MAASVGAGLGSSCHGQHAAWPSQQLPLNPGSCSWRRVRGPDLRGEFTDPSGHGSTGPNLHAEYAA